MKHPGTCSSPAWPLAWLHPELTRFGAATYAELHALLTHAGRESETPRLWRVSLGDERRIEVASLESAASAERAHGVWLLPLAAEGALSTRIQAWLAESETVAQLAGLRPIPCFHTARVPAGRTVQTRLAPSFWGLLPGDHYPERLRRAFHALFRLLHPERFLRFLALENHALAGFDLAAEFHSGRFFGSELGARDRPRSTREGQRARVIGIDGMDGAGKSTHLAALRAWLEDECGRSTAVHKIYRHGVFHDTVTDLTRRCAGGNALHLWRMQRVAKAFDSVKYYYRAVEPDLATHDVLLFDRYLDTHHAAGCGRYHHDPHARELLSVYPRPDLVVLLDLPTERTLARLHQRAGLTVDENPYMLSRYRHVLRDRAARHGALVLDSWRPFEENQAKIRAAVRDLLESAP